MIVVLRCVKHRKTKHRFTTTNGRGQNAGKKKLNTHRKKAQKKLRQLPPNETRTDTFKNLYSNMGKRTPAKEKYSEFLEDDESSRQIQWFSPHPKVSCCHGSKPKPLSKANERAMQTSRGPTLIHHLGITWRFMASFPSKYGKMM